MKLLMKENPYMVSARNTRNMILINNFKEVNKNMCCNAKSRLIFIRYLKTYWKSKKKILIEPKIIMFFKVVFLISNFLTLSVIKMMKIIITNITLLTTLPLTRPVRKGK